MSNLTPPQPRRQRIYVNASALGKSACPFYFKCQSIDGLHGLHPNIPIEYGKAFHKFLAAWRSGTSLEESVTQAQLAYANIPVLDGDMRNIGHLFNTCFSYAAEYKNDGFVVSRSREGKPLVEMTFAWPWLVEDDLEIILCGTLDAIGELNGVRCFSDAKTTSVYNKRGYLEAYKLSHQMMFYRYILDLLASRFPETFGCMSELPCFIDGVFLAKAASTFARSDLICFSAQQMKHFSVALQAFLDRLLLHYRRGAWPKDGLVLGQCEQKYGKCAYFEVCSQRDEEGEEFVKRTEFAIQEYNPTQFYA